MSKAGEEFPVRLLRESRRIITRLFFAVSAVTRFGKMKIKSKNVKKPAKLQDLKVRKDVKGAGGIPRSIDSRIATNHNETFLRG